MTPLSSIVEGSDLCEREHGECLLEAGRGLLQRLQQQLVCAVTIAGLLMGEPCGAQGSHSERTGRSETLDEFVGRVCAVPACEDVELEAATVQVVDPLRHAVSHQFGAGAGEA